MTLNTESGLYAWWASAGVLPGMSGPPHPSIDGLELLYVGVAKDLRRRLIRNHFSGPTGSSTLRRALAALLMSSQAYTTRWTKTRVVPVDPDEVRLTAWMRHHLRVAWVEHAKPKAVEAAVIAELAPPLNQAHNTSHPLYPLVATARASYRRSAGPRPQMPESVATERSSG